jgi:hypothetical protein
MSTRPIKTCPVCQSYEYVVCDTKKVEDTPLMGGRSHSQDREWQRPCASERRRALSQCPVLRTVRRTSRRPSPRRAPQPILDGLPSKAKPSHIIVVVAQELVLALIVGRDVRKVDFVSQDTADSTKALDELRAFLGLVCDKLRIPKVRIMNIWR